MKAAIRAKAAELGFAEARFAPARPVAGAAEDLAGYLGEKRHGDMAWMAETAPRRADPLVLWPAARSIVMLGENYRPAGDPLAGLAHRERGYVSVYARGRDYHDGLKKRLRALAGWLVETHGGEVKIFTDTAPVMEKPLAAAAGLGWQGRHTNLVSRRFGSWLFLGEVFTTLDIPPDAPESDHCGACRACETICPTGALANRRIDPRRCVSYLTIEHKGPIDRALRPLLGNRIYGCDDCLAVCPWNKFAKPLTLDDYRPRAELQAPALADLARLDDAAFRAVFAGSPIKRIGRDRFLRNVLMALGNAGGEKAGRLAFDLLSDSQPLVRAAAVWAACRHLPPSSARTLAQERLAGENDPWVQDEWTAVLEGCGCAC